MHAFIHINTYCRRFTYPQYDCHYSWLRISATTFDGLYDLPKWNYPKSLQEQRKQILIMFERNFADYLLKNPEIFDKLSEMMFNTCRPFEIFSLYFSWKSYLVMLKVYFEN